MRARRLWPVAALISAVAVSGASAQLPHGSAKPKKVTKIKLRLDTRHKRSGPVTVSGGGKVTTTAANGAKLTLTVSKRALLGDAAITLTPVNGISGLPRGAKLLGAVQLGPEGLGLLKDATLTIRVPRARGVVHALAWHGKGQQVSAYRVARSGLVLRLSLDHFSGAGVYIGPAGSFSSPQDAETAYFHQVVQPHMTTAVSDEGSAAQAVQEWVGWERGVSRFPDTFLAQERNAVAQLFPKITRNQVNKAYERCTTQHDVGQELRKLLTLRNQADLSSGGSVFGHGLHGDALAEATGLPAIVDDRLKKCGSFELDYEITIDASADSGGAHLESSSHVRVLGLHMQAVGSDPDHTFPPPVSQQIEYLRWHFSEPLGGGYGYVDNGVTLGAPFQADRLSFGADDSALTLDVLPGTPTEHIILQPGGMGAQDLTNYHDWFLNLHQDEATGSMIRIPDWSVLHGSVWARKTYSRTKTVTQGGATTLVTEHSTFDLKHTPGQVGS